MTNTDLLEEKIRISGKKKNHLAKKVGLSSTGFRMCVVNKAQFKTEQIKILCDELGIKTPQELHDIFFA